MLSRHFHATLSTMYSSLKGNIPEPEAGSPSRKMTGKLVGEVRRLSTISEQEMDKPDTDSGGRAGSGLSVCSDRFKSSSSVFSSDDSYQPDSGGMQML